MQLATAEKLSHTVWQLSQLIALELQRVERYLGFTQTCRLSFLVRLTRQQRAAEVLLDTARNALHLPVAWIDQHLKSWLGALVTGQNVL
eukprot:COSAG02_NODE_14919_length_1224_cov_0.762667_2_plen_89_part_00